MMDEQGREECRDVLNFLNEEFSKTIEQTDKTDKTEQHLKDIVERAIESLIVYRIALSKEHIVDVINWPVPE